MEKENAKDKETDEDSETTTKTALLRAGKKIRKESTTEQSRYTIDAQEKTEKVKRKKKTWKGETKHANAEYVVEIAAKRETVKTTERYVIKTSEKDMENTMETKETVGRLNATTETEIDLVSVMALNEDKKIMRLKNDLSTKNKKHLTTKHYNYDRNRDQEREEKKKKKKLQKQNNKELLRQELKKGKKKETHNKLKKQRTTTNGYTLKEKETRPGITVAFESPDVTPREALRGKVQSTKAYHNIDEPSMDFLNPYSLTKQLQKLLCELRCTNVTLTTIGRSASYSDIILLQATELQRNSLRSDKPTKYEDDLPEKKIIFIVHGLSIWGFSGVKCLSVINPFLLLLKNYLEHLDKFDIYLIPMANPDGVAYSRHRAAWNKNISPQDACPGVALDRNFDVAWNEGPILSSCSQQYAGNHAFSEYETQAIREVFHRLSHKIVAYIHVHGGGYNENVFKGDAVLYPKGFTEAPGDDDKYVDLKGEIEETMRNASFKVISVSVDTLFNWYGKVTGTSVDYASTIYGIPFALEFVMQVYGDDEEDESSYSFKDAAQTEIWHRIIDVIFRNIHKTAVKKETSTDLRKYKNAG